MTLTLKSLLIAKKIAEQALLAIPLEEIENILAHELAISADRLADSSRSDFPLSLKLGYIRDISVK
jgi:hypothetical protein